MTINTDKLKHITEYGKEFDRDAELPEIEKIAGLYPRGFLSLYAAQAGTGKTWFMQYISCKISRGGNILAGLVAKSKPMKVVIFAGETGKYLLDKRLQATCWAYDKKRIRVYDAVELQRDDIPIMLNTQEGRMTTIAILAQEKPDIIFYDTLISFHTADESKQGEMTSIMTFLLKLAKEFNCAVVLNHHTRKRSTKNPNAKLTQDDVIGSNIAVRLSSCVFIAEQVADEFDESQGMPAVHVSNVKNWEKRIPDFTYKFITDEGSDLLDFAIEWGTSAISEEWSLRDRVKKLVESYEAGSMLRVDDVASALVTSKDNARKYLDELVKKGKLTKQKLMNAMVWRVNDVKS